VPLTRVAVEIVRGDVRAAVRRALDGAGWKQAIPEGADVALKVNLGWDLFIPGSITSPLVAESLILELRDRARRIFVVEANQVLEDADRAFERSGMARVCARTGATWVNMSRAPFVRARVPQAAVLERILVPEILREAVLVTVPVMKTHAKTGISGALKNQWGCLPEMRHQHHLVLDDALADLNAVVRPALSLMDATVALEGDGPKSGRPRIADRILCSSDPVALDTVQCLIMGVDPASVGHLTTCARRGVGTADPAAIEVCGTGKDVTSLGFAPAKHNAVSAVELLLRRSRAKRLVFDTPLFGACLLGAKLYYHGWTLLRASSCWRPILAHPVYGPQWRSQGRA